jgi:NTE family protein
MNLEEVKTMNKPTIGLALSGSGYRATLFSLATLWRLNVLALLSKVKTMASVSDSSITAGHLVCNWHPLRFNENTGVAANF